MIDPSLVLMVAGNAADLAVAAALLQSFPSTPPHSSSPSRCSANRFSRTWLLAALSAGPIASDLSGAERR